MGCRIDVYIVEIAIDVRQFHQALVHDVEPEPGYVGEDVHAEVAIRKLRQVLKMPQRLVAPKWVRMVIRVPFQMEQDEVAEDVVAVPGMMRFA